MFKILCATMRGCSVAGSLSIASPPVEPASEAATDASVPLSLPAGKIEVPSSPSNHEAHKLRGNVLLL